MHRVHHRAQLGTEEGTLPQSETAATDSPQLPAPRPPVHTADASFGSGGLSVGASGYPGWVRSASAERCHFSDPPLGWLEHDGEPPFVEGTLVGWKVEHLSKERDAPPVCW